MLFRGRRSNGKYSHWAPRSKIITANNNVEKVIRRICDFNSRSSLGLSTVLAKAFSGLDRSYKKSTRPNKTGRLKLVQASPTFFRGKRGAPGGELVIILSVSKFTFFFSFLFYCFRPLFGIQLISAHYCSFTWSKLSSSFFLFLTYIRLY